MTERSSAASSTSSATASCGAMHRPATVPTRPLQPLRAPEQGRGVRPYLPDPGIRKHRDRNRDDQQHPYQGASHRCQPAEKGAFPRQIGRTRGGLNSKLHAVCDGDGKPIVLLLTAGQVSDYRGADTIVPALPVALGEALRRAFRAVPTVKSRLSMIASFTRVVTSSSVCLVVSRIGVASPRAMTGVHTLFSVPSVLLSRSSSGYES